MGKTSQPVEIHSVLQKLSIHLDFLAGRVFEVEEELGKLILGGKSSEEVSITKIQSLDFTRQSLEDCAILLQVLKRHVSDTSFRVSCDVVSSNKLKLNSTKSILGSSLTNAETDVSGQVDIF